MKYQQLGISDLRVSNIILGTWALGGWMWGGVADNRPIDTIHAALDSGINCIDTAPVYGFGLSEELVGQALKGRRDGVVVATKFGLRWDLQEGEFYFDTVDNNGKGLQVYKCVRKWSIIEECERSLRRLGIDTIDLYQCHWPHLGADYGEMMEALLLLREQGKIREFGVSNFSVEQMDECRAVSNIVSLQPPYSLLARGIEDGVLGYCYDNNISVICYSPMYRGLLTGKFLPGHMFKAGDARAGDPWFGDDKLELLQGVMRQVIFPMAESYGCCASDIAVAWCLAQRGVCAALVGARNPKQVVANVRAAEIDLAVEDVRQVTLAFDSLVRNS